jgi:hypothetical protein
MKARCLRAVQFLVAAGVLAGAASVKAQGPGPLSPGNYVQDPLQLMLDCRAVQDKGTGFTATFTKHERIKGELHESETMLMKCRYSPFSVYFKWQKGSKGGREVIYFEGKNENKVVGHQPPLPFNIKLVPNSSDALKESIRPITMAGFRSMLDAMIKVTTEAKQAGHLKIFCTEDVYNGRPAYCILRVLPKKQNYPYNLLYVHMDKELMAPVHIAAYDWDDNLVSSYVFSDVKLNPPLADKDFDVDSSSYGFAKDLLKGLFGGKQK